MHLMLSLVSGALKRIATFIQTYCKNSASQDNPVFRFKE